MKNNQQIDEDFKFALENHKKNNLKVAEEIYNKILKIDPNHFPSNVLLGTLSVQTKNFVLAKELLQKSIKINPNHPEAHYNLGLVFNELLDFEKAINCYEKAIKINPDYADAHNNLGNCYKESGDFEKAINCYEEAIKINSNYADANNNLGIVFKKLGEDQKAINYYKKAIQLEPAHQEAYYNFGLALEELGEEQQAISCYEKAIEINPDYADAHNNLGNCYKESGDFEKAISFYEKATKSKPENLAYFYPLSDLKKEILGANLKNIIKKIINDNNCTKKNMAFGNFLLARYESEEKNYENEIDFLIKAHNNYFEFKKNKFSEQLKHWFEMAPNVDKLINLSKSNKNNKQIKPIFIVGVPRCGSTLLEKIIASGTKYIPIGEETSILDKLVKQKINMKSFEKENFELKVIKKYEQKSLIQEKNDYIFTDKSLENFFYIGLIIAIFPQAKVINCKRNALSSIMSILKNNLPAIPWTHNLEHIFKYFDIYYRTIAHYEKTFPNFIYSLDYEKLVNNPENESKKLMKYCNLPWDKKCLEFYKRKDLISKTASNVQIRQAIYKDSIKKYLPYKKFLDKYGEKYTWYN